MTSEVPEQEHKEQLLSDVTAYNEQKVARVRALEVRVQQQNAEKFELDGELKLTITESARKADHLLQLCENDDKTLEVRLLCAFPLMCMNFCIRQRKLHKGTSTMSWERK